MYLIALHVRGGVSFGFRPLPFCIIITGRKFPKGGWSGKRRLFQVFRYGKRGLSGATLSLSVNVYP